MKETKKKTLWTEFNVKESLLKIKELQESLVYFDKMKLWDKRKKTQNRIMNSIDAKFLACHKVRTNKGSKTAGTDGKLYKTDAEWMKIMRGLNLGPIKFKPFKVVRIESPKGRWRRLGIPTLKDRCYQALLLLCIDPIYEARAGLNSYGFRKFRNIWEPRNEIKRVLDDGVPKGKFTHVLEVDFTKCFDEIDHEWIVKRTPYQKKRIKQVVKIQLSEQGIITRNQVGTPQGGIISPLLANIALSFVDDFCELPILRYADDVVIFGIEEELQNIKIKLKNLLENTSKNRLNWNKSSITCLKEGFDFVGYRFYYDTRTRILPREKKLMQFVDRINELINDRKTPEDQHYINLVLGGWWRHYYDVESNEAFRLIDSITDDKCWKMTNKLKSLRQMPPWENPYLMSNERFLNSKSHNSKKGNGDEEKSKTISMMDGGVSLYGPHGISLH